ncbi:ROK family protein [Paenibacillus sp. FJAT-26967]|uniref:ROK family protein n=1 Tax=Paenibacillus sp. FJAT-26967 TaxID=1729690 RepID=UPI000839117C|nr:ROK family protein [Paenibacillus sp. FJAT-26967]
MNTYVGIEIDGGQMFMMAEIAGGSLEHTVPTGADCTLLQLQQEVEAFISKLPYTPRGIGMGMPGLVIGSDKVELSHVLPALNGATAAMFETSANIPVAFINDVKAATMAEAAYFTDKETVIVIMSDAYIAAGVVASGELLLGAKGWSGEMGYMILTVDGKAVLLDTLASGQAIMDQAGMDDAALRKHLEADDEQVTSLINQAGQYFGYALTNLLHMYNPDVIVVGGSTPTYKGYMEAAIGALQMHALPELLNCCTLTTPKIQNRVIAFGAREWIRKCTQL